MSRWGAAHHHRAHDRQATGVGYDGTLVPKQVRIDKHSHPHAAVVVAPDRRMQLCEQLTSQLGSGTDFGEQTRREQGHLAE